MAAVTGRGGRRQRPEKAREAADSHEDTDGRAPAKASAEDGGMGKGETNGLGESNKIAKKEDGAGESV
jgi:hypothetical protein